MKDGIKPIKLDHRDHSFQRTFGAVSSSLLLPSEYICDAGFGAPDQNVDGLPYGCSGYAQSELCQDEDSIHYKPEYTYDKTRLMEGTYPSPVGCDIRDSLKSTLIYGVQGLDETTDQEAFGHHRGQYFNVGPTEDYFEGIINALWLNRLEKRSVSMGTPWFPEWLPPVNGGKVQADGIVSVPQTYDLAHVPWHNWKICGWKTMNGIRYLIGKPWCGPDFGDKGFCYFPQEIINKIMSIEGSAAFTLGKANKDNIVNVKLNLIDMVLSYIRMLINKILK